MGAVLHMHHLQSGKWCLPLKRGGARSRNPKMSNAPKLPSAHCGVMRGIAGSGREREIRVTRRYTRSSPPFTQ